MNDEYSTRYTTIQLATGSTIGRDARFNSACRVSVAILELSGKCHASVPASVCRQQRYDIANGSLLHSSNTVTEITRYRGGSMIYSREFKGWNRFVPREHKLLQASSENCTEQPQLCRTNQRERFSHHATTVAWIAYDAEGCCETPCHISKHPVQSKDDLDPQLPAVTDSVAYATSFLLFCTPCTFNLHKQQHFLVAVARNQGTPSGLVFPASWVAHGGGGPILPPMSS